MRNRIIIALLILTIGYWIVSSQSIFSDVYKTSNLEQENKIKENQDQIIERKDENVKDKKIDETKKFHIPDDIIQEISQELYSSEPIIEVITASKLMFDCQSKKYLNHSVSKISKKYEVMYLKSQKDCDEILNNFPLISEISENKEFEHLFMKVAMQSDYAKFFQKTMAQQFMSDEEKQALETETIKLITNSKNAPIIELLGEMPLTGRSQPYYNQLFIVLGTLNSNYAKLILSQSSILFSCQYNQGITCSPTSTYMLKQCVQNDSACGLDVQTWFQTHNTPAHNRDIAKLVDFLESQAQ